MKVPAGLATMNSKELNVNVPLATGESDSEEFEVSKMIFNKEICQKNNCLVR